VIDRYLPDVVEEDLSTNCAQKLKLHSRLSNPTFTVLHYRHKSTATTHSTCKMPETIIRMLLHPSQRHRLPNKDYFSLAFDGADWEVGEGD